ncbi:acyl-CoA dehydrogenase family protein [Streptomyces avidinii]|uniref:Alkylation response protein AidB-like acyl-CoA dehydrogenase n=1 Tax=Streptomyces avidinii TaxID=1895 RepID=A0ABS4L445_STRAV|nr:acyl-CoA dehydrogenase family protein [Streptomyces avidinii]MBP2036864.1 alkylation response protein AidB-like acyl-CoA dehydrogenase [Streptomyces avidinii]GGY93480.1 isovaleryl-CoA dehydrogenase [Streptomyces avidinii]
MTSQAVNENGTGGRSAPAVPERWREREDEDSLFRQLRLTVRQGLEVDGDTPAGSWEALTQVGAWEFALPIGKDGLDLGQAVIAMVCEEAGNAMQPVPLTDTLLALDLVSGLGPLAAESTDHLLDRVRTGELEIAVPGRLPDPRGTVPPGITWKPDGDTGAVVLTGTGGPFAAGIGPGALLVLAGGPDGPCVALVGLPTEGVEVRPLRDHGGGAVAGAVFDEVRLPAEAVLLRGLAAERALARVGLRAAVHQASLLAGITAAALTAVVSRIRGRQQFGQALVKHQGPRLRVAGLLARLDAVRWAVGDAARDLDEDRLTVGEAAGLIALTAETTLDVTRDAVHLHGASGLVRDALVAGCYRRAAWEAMRCGRPAQLWDTAAHTP